LQKLHTLEVFEAELLSSLKRHEVHLAEIGTENGEIRLDEGNPGRTRKQRTHFDDESEYSLSVADGRSGVVDDWSRSPPNKTAADASVGVGAGARELTEQQRQRLLQRALDLIIDLSDFQLSVLQSRNSLQAADNYLRAKPETVVNRIVAHLKYLFGVQNLDGMLPRMNQVR
jgi:hypothetical protein